MVKISLVRKLHNKKMEFYGPMKSYIRHLKGNQYRAVWFRIAIVTGKNSSKHEKLCSISVISPVVFDKKKVHAGKQ